MSLLDDMKNDKKTLLTMVMAVREMAAGLGLDTDDLCRLALEHSSEVDKRQAEIEKIFGTHELPPLGDLLRQPSADSAELIEWRLREQMLRFRLNHPDALVTYFDGRVDYSDGFIRFILERLDLWEFSHERFCEQVEVPYQTLCSWIKEQSSTG